MIGVQPSKNIQGFLGVSYDKEFSVHLLPNYDFKSRLFETLRIKKSILEKGGGTKEHPLTALCNLFAKRSAFENNRAAFGSSYQDYIRSRVLTFELAILGHTLFPKNLEGVDMRLFAFRKQIKKGHTFVPALLADSF